MDWDDASNMLSNATSNVELFLKDQLGEPIKNLKVEVRGLGDKAEHVYHTGVTDAKGALKFVAKKGEDISVHVKHWTKDEMKQIAQLFPGLDNMRYLLQSPKFVKEIETKLEAKAGHYKRNIHLVLSGETLSSIAHKFDTSVDLLKHVNNLKDDIIQTGKHLKIPPAISKVLQTITDFNFDGNPFEKIKKGPVPVIFPINVRPLNDANGKYKDYLWTKDAQNGSQAVFGRNRSGGKRKHAARDLYLDNFTEVVAVAPGVVLSTGGFYMSTDQVSIHHTTSDGRQFVVRYGELDPKSIQVKPKDKIEQGAVVGKSGILKSKKGNPAAIVKGQNVSMLHFEYFTGSLGIDTASNLTNTGKGHNVYMRRGDIADPLDILQEGYKATFLDGAVPQSLPTGNRTPIAQLKLSDKGKAFIKDYEKLRLDYYDDAKGYCTIGWGHLVGTKSCASLGKIGSISMEEAVKLFEEDAPKHEAYVKRSINVPLYQNEYDALCSLAFNIGNIGAKAPNLCRLINSQKYSEGATQFLDITNGGMAGLKKRRNQEYQMFTEAKYDSTH